MDNTQITNDNDQVLADNYRDFILQNKELIMKIVEDAMAAHNNSDSDNKEECTCTCDNGCNSDGCCNHDDKCTCQNEGNKELVNEIESLKKQLEEKNQEIMSLKDKVHSIFTENVFIPNKTFAKVMNGIIVAENAGTIDNIASEVINAVKDSNDDIKDITKGSKTRRVKHISSKIEDDPFPGLFDLIFADPIYRTLFR